MFAILSNQNLVLRTHFFILEGAKLIIIGDVLGPVLILNIGLI